MYKVSVIIPIYNVEAYLRDCLDSVVNQTLQEIEIICVDDGSPDRSAEIVTEYMERHSNIKLIRKENGGLSSARNAGMDVATGEYVYFLDSDDYLELQALECLFEKAAQEQLDILYFNTRNIFESEQLRKANPGKSKYYARSGDYSGICTGQTMFSRMCKDDKFLASVWIQLFRREFLEENGIRFYYGILQEDNLFSFQCAMTARRVNYIPDVLYCHVIRENSIMTVPKTIRHVEGCLVSYYEALVFLRGFPLQADAAEFVEPFLYTSLFCCAAAIWQLLPEAERQKPIAHGGAGVKQMLLLARKKAEQEAYSSRLKERNTILTKKLKQTDKKLKQVNRKLAEATRKRGPVAYIKAFFRAVVDRGAGYALRKAAVKVSRGVAAVMSRCTWGSWKQYFILARKTGYRTARRELIRQQETQKRQQQVLRQMETGGEEPLVSFILPVYNVAAYLPQALDSLLCQTLKHIEIICVDDGSTDNSLQILRSYEKKDPRVKVFTQKNQYAGAARNHGLSKATGEYVCFLDPDDFFEKELAQQTYFAAKMADADAVLFDARHFDDMTKEFRQAPWLFEKSYVPKTEPFCRPETLYQITTPCPWTKLFRRRFVVEEGLQFQTIRHTNDAFFIMSALALAKRIVTVDRQLVNYRVNVSTSLQATKGKDPMCFYEAFRALRDLLRERGVMEQLRRSYVSAVLGACLHNVRTQKDPQIRQVIETALGEYVFRELELSGHEPDYYHNNGDYKEMLRILGADRL